MAFRDVLFLAEDSDPSPDEAVCDSSPAVDLCAFAHENLTSCFFNENLEKKSGVEMIKD